MGRECNPDFNRVTFREYYTYYSLTLPYSSPFGGAAAAEALDEVGFFEVEEDVADHVAADHGAGFFEVGEAEVGDEGLDGVLDGFGFVAPAGADPVEACFKFGIGGEQGAEEVFRPWPDIVFSLMPSLGGEVERLIVGLFGFLDDAFEADEATHFVALVIEREEGKQAGHAAIPIGEGMDAEEVENVEGNEKQRIPSPIAPGIGKVLVENAHGVFGEVRGHGFETNALVAIRQGFADFIGGNFPMTAIVPGVFEEVVVELEHDTIGERNVGVILMDGIEHVAVAGDLAFGAVGGFSSRGD